MSIATAEPTDRGQSPRANHLGSRAGRIEGFDLARALAVFGMVVVNFKIAMMGASPSETHPLLSAAGLLEGRAAATFVVLAGVGLALMSNRPRLSHDLESLRRCRISLFKRAALLFVVGLLYTPIWPADILHFYGVFIAVGACLLAASSRTLWAAAAAFTAGFVVLILAFDYERGWNFDTLAYLDLWTAPGMVRHLFFNGFHPAIPWTAFLLLGLIVGRQDLRNPQRRRLVFLSGVAVAAVAEIVSHILIRSFTVGASAEEREVIVALLGTAPMPPMPLYILAGGGVACAVIAACVSLTERFPGAPVLKPLIATGQLALTLYVAHVIIGMGVLESLGRLENQPAGPTLLAAATFCLLAVVFSTLWRHRFAQGPLEWLVRRISRA